MPPIVNEESLTADEAIAKNLCPECGADLTKSSPIGHRNGHWRTLPPPGVDGDEARRRMGLLDKFIADHNIKTSDVLERERKAAAEKPPAQ